MTETAEGDLKPAPEEKPAFDERLRPFINQALKRHQRRPPLPGLPSQSSRRTARQRLPGRWPDRRRDPARRAFGADRHGA